MPERRSHIRYSVTADITLKTEEGSSYSFKTGVTNISFRGATIFSQDRIELENKVVFFELVTELSKEPLVGKGIIKYVAKEERKTGAPIYKMGLEFVDINKSTIMHFISRLQEIRSAKMKRFHRVQKPKGDFFGPL